MPKKIRHSELTQIGLFRHLTAEEATEVALRLERRSLGPKKTLLAYGQTGSGVYFLRRGLVKVSVPPIDGDEGRETILNICGRGEVLGEIDAINGKGHSGNVITLSRSVLWWMPTSCFRSCLERYPKLSFTLNEILAQRVQRLSAKDNCLMTLDSEGRLARQILLLARDHGIRTQAGIAIPVPLTQRELAALVGSTRERVNRMLAHFHQQGFLLTGADGCLIVSDCGALNSCCVGCMDRASFMEQLRNSENN